MRLIILLCSFALPISCICFAQSDNTESLTITTYYPSPRGVYKTLRMFPTAQPFTGSSAIQAGTMYFNQSDQKLYIFNGTLNDWTKIGAGDSSSNGPITVIDSGYKVWPDICLQTVITRTIVGGHGIAHLCPTAWLKKVAFSKIFKKIPHVYVSADTLSGSLDDNMDDYYTCGEHSTDSLQAFPQNVTRTGFDLRVGSSASRGSGCCVSGDCTDPYDVQMMGYFGKGEASWIAIGE